MKHDDTTIFSSYERNPSLYDEIFDENGNVQKTYETLFDLYGKHSIEDYVNLNAKAKASFFNQGITFQVYNEKKTQEKIFPFDLFPRIIHPEEWDIIERGAIQRSKALNLFLWDIYHEKKNYTTRNNSDGAH